ncbi:MAG: cytochrome c [Acidobacteria bacterium]|nr:cytochrome c [Acidobacteriota bacterium]
MNRVLLLACLGSCLPVLAHDPITTKITFTREISRIFYKRCAGCHKEGGKAPMSLVTYEEARPWAKAIKEEVLERRMPPWGAVKGFGAFRNEQALSQEDISIIADWVEGGAPEGELKYMPEKPNADPPAIPALKGSRLAVTGAASLPAVRLIGIQPQAKAEIASVRVVAEQPDGTIEPLLWLRNYKPQWKQVFEFRQPMALAAGSRIHVEPPGQASFVLITRPGL